VHGLGEEAVQRLIETLQSAPANEATEVIGLLSQLSPEAWREYCRRDWRSGRGLRMTGPCGSYPRRRRSRGRGCWRCCTTRWIR